MDAGTRRLRITRSRSKRGFLFTFGLRANPAGQSASARWWYRLGAVPIAIAAIAFGVFSLVLIVIVTFGAVCAYAIAWWWRRRKLARAAPVCAALDGEYVVVDLAGARGVEPEEIAARVAEPTGSPPQ